MDFLEPFQSGFRPIFGMVTTLVALLDDLDGGKCVPPGLVRSRGSFDTVNPGLEDIALHWFHSFLSNDFQSILVGEEKCGLVEYLFSTDF